MMEHSCFNFGCPAHPNGYTCPCKEYEEDGYSGVKRVAMWHLDDLPTNDDFISAFKQEEEE